MDSIRTQARDVARFVGRQDAGISLACLLTAYSRRSDAVVVAIPRGGIPVAIPIARTLHLPLCVEVVEKIRVPMHEVWQPAQCIGAVASGSACAVNAAQAHALQLSPVETAQALACAQSDQASKTGSYHAICPEVSIRNQTVLLIDDVVSSGATMRAAIEALRPRHPARIVVAVPVGAMEAIRELRTLADEVVCPATIENGWAIHECYARFPPMTDAAACALLESVNHRRIQVGARA